MKRALRRRHEVSACAYGPNGLTSQRVKALRLRKHLEWNRGRPPAVGHFYDGLHCYLGLPATILTQNI
jgi:hypothetical protein